METKQDILNIQTNADVNQNKVNYSNEELLHKERIDNTPFYIIGNNEQGYFITYGKYRITERKNTIVEIREELEKDRWTIITVLIAVLIQITDEIKEKNI